jgi:hypothetical protein
MMNWFSLSKIRQGGTKIVEHFNAGEAAVRTKIIGGVPGENPPCYSPRKHAQRVKEYQRVKYGKKLNKNSMRLIDTHIGLKAINDNILPEKIPKNYRHRIHHTPYTEEENQVLLWVREKNIKDGLATYPVCKPGTSHLDLLKEIAIVENSTALERVINTGVYLLYNFFSVRRELLGFNRVVNLEIIKYINQESDPEKCQQLIRAHETTKENVEIVTKIFKKDFCEYPAIKRRICYDGVENEIILNVHYNEIIPMYTTEFLFLEKYPNIEIKMALLKHEYREPDFVFQVNGEKKTIQMKTTNNVQGEKRYEKLAFDMKNKKKNNPCNVDYLCIETPNEYKIYNLKKPEPEAEKIIKKTPKILREIAEHMENDFKKNGDEIMQDHTFVNNARSIAITGQTIEAKTKVVDEIKTYSRKTDESENIKPSSISGRKTEGDPFAELKERENKVLEEKGKQYREEQEQKKAEKVTEEKTKKETTEQENKSTETGIQQEKRTSDADDVD